MSERSKLFSFLSSKENARANRTLLPKTAFDIYLLTHINLDVKRVRIENKQERYFFRVRAVYIESKQANAASDIFFSSTETHTLSTSYLQIVDNLYIKSYKFISVGILARKIEQKIGR